MLDALSVGVVVDRVHIWPRLAEGKRVLEVVTLAFFRGRLLLGRRPRVPAIESLGVYFFTRVYLPKPIDFEGRALVLDVDLLTQILVSEVNSLLSSPGMDVPVGFQSSFAVTREQILDRL